jgi:hypothetical protein
VKSKKKKEIKTIRKREKGYKKYKIKRCDGVKREKTDIKTHSI